MAGTEGTFGYNVVAISESGRLGYRMLSDGRVRIRIEPSSMSSSAAIGMSLPKEQGWKQPGDDGQDRFSVVVDRNLLSFMLSKAISGLLESGSAVELHPEAPGWLRTVMEHARCHEVSATGSPAEKVEHFLLQSFNSFELKRFVCRNFEVLSHEIQFDGKPIGEATFDLVQALQRHGLLNAKLVSALKEARPNKAYELDRLGLS
jgi:hypothetical protein